MKRYAWFFLTAILAVCGCSQPSELVGEWRSTVQFQSGPFASIKDLEFLYVFNEGGTMTESSNYDSAPPVAPAYGIWRKVASGNFEAKYEFFVTRPPASEAESIPGGGWLPGGRGVLLETITLSEDGKSFTSTITYKIYEKEGASPQDGGTAAGRGSKMTF